MVRQCQLVSAPPPKPGFCQRRAWRTSWPRPRTVKPCTYHTLPWLAMRLTVAWVFAPYHARGDPYPAVV